MRADDISMHHRSIAKRRASSIESFYAIERYRKPASVKTRIAFAAAALLVVVTVWMAVK